ncbi:MAG: Stp1/IreP family PP2C-type Ser/Thr phosphatase [Ignavibacteriae bacterium]|nr:Stp1/IreP family PP2C-type Ser/Thr phosphatase [Ignavibacteriota bacterium]
MVRSENQDAVGCFPQDNPDIFSPRGQLFVIADGMGGHAGGREASRLAVETMQKAYFGCSRPSIPDCLKLAFKVANSVIYEKSLFESQLNGMGTTCIAMVIQGNSVSFAHIGDSRLYRIGEHSIEQLTDDHSKVAEMVRRGMITEEEASVHPERSMLYRAMGVQPDMQFDLLNGIELRPNEFYLMCTDGLTGVVAPDEIHKTVLSTPLQDVCSALIDLANTRGGPDNITVQCIQVSGEDSSFQKVIDKISFTKKK